MRKDAYRWFHLDNPYAYRDDNLQRLGFSSYGRYLKSELWKTIRAAVLERDHHRCQFCGRLAKTAHHRAYDPATLAGECLNALSAICQRCHKRVEEPDNFRRSRWDRLHDSSTAVMKKARKRKFRIVYEPIWAQHIKPPTLVKRG